MNGKTSNKINIILDIVMALVIIGIFAVKGHLHENFGYILGALVVIHVILHWKQITVMFRQLVPHPVAQIVVLVIFILLVAASIYVLPGLAPQGHGHYGPPPGIRSSF